jgi:hypothetical protein
MAIGQRFLEWIDRVRGTEIEHDYYHHHMDDHTRRK